MINSVPLIECVHTGSLFLKPVPLKVLLMDFQGREAGKAVTTGDSSVSLAGTPKILELLLWDVQARSWVRTAAREGEDHWNYWGV